MRICTGITAIGGVNISGPIAVKKVGNRLIVSICCLGTIDHDINAVRILYQTIIGLIVRESSTLLSRNVGVKVVPHALRGIARERGCFYEPVGGWVVIVVGHIRVVISVFLVQNIACTITIFKAHNIGAHHDKTIGGSTARCTMQLCTTIGIAKIYAPSHVVEFERSVSIEFQSPFAGVSTFIQYAKSFFILRSRNQKVLASIIAASLIFERHHAFARSQRVNDVGLGRSSSVEDGVDRRSIIAFRSADAVNRCNGVGIVVFCEAEGRQAAIARNGGQGTFCIFLCNGHNVVAEVELSAGEMAAGS